MKVTFLGAAETVTGSCFLVEGGGKRFLVDCGMFQGKEEKMNEQPFEFDITSIDFMLLTHAHIDHSGRIPKLVKEGYGGPIYTTKATADLCSILLPDSGHIQEMEIEWQNRKRMRAGKEPIEPLYTAEDAQLSLKNFQHMFYDDVFELDDNISFRFRDAGHILGSSIIEIWLKENGGTIKLVFSGDLGQKNQPILRDPTVIEDADYVFIESTYGNRLHEDTDNRVEMLNAIISRTVGRGGNVVIPSFAVGRTQELLYHLNILKEDKEHNYLKGVKVFIDSPLAISATKIFQDNPQCYDAQTLQLLKSGDNPFEFDKLYFIRTSEDSMKINEEKGGAVIISASGMCDAGRIKHHLKHNLWRKESSIVFVGYQAEGTLGRIIKDGAEKVKIFGEEIRILAEIEDIQGFSGHADRDGLLEWLNGFTSKPKKIFVVHGEQDSARDFAETIRERTGIEAVVAKLGQTVQIGMNTAAVAGGDTKFDMGSPGLSEVTVRIMQVKVDFMEAMDALYDKITAGEITADEAKNVLDEIKKAIR
ncbi:MAG: Metallo-beta-lactamase family protein, RNA-specific [Firmicutes bacterium]|nr:Metallo-beta-lactamase family protein, RNA-specific [Bacillota bacterium]MDI6706999.1 MBL fold metallo-hydrolase [Bacillota bacterium]